MKDFKDFVCRTLHIDEFFFLKKCMIIDNLFTLNDAFPGFNFSMFLQPVEILGKKVPLILVNYF